MPSNPNVIIFLADDLGFSDLGCYGSEIRTPNLNALAAQGVRLTNFHNTPRCSPSRASLLTGLHPHQAGMGILANDDSADGGYRGKLNDRCWTAAEILRSVGYATAVRGKWHLTPSVRTPDDAWPTRRGFDSFYGTLTGCGSYYQPGTLARDLTSADAEAADPDFFYTDRIADEAVDFLTGHAERCPDRPYFLYVPFTAPHWPLHARPETIDRYAGVYEAGWDVLRRARFEKQGSLGIIEDWVGLSPRDPAVPAWEDEPNKEWQAARMRVYASMVEEMDQAVGRILGAAEAVGLRDDTIVIFLSDNGASADAVPLIELEHFRERRDILRVETKSGQAVRIGNDPLVTPGAEDTYASYGRAWANLSNTPFRLFKLWTHEGGIASPFILSWPEGGVPSGQVIDVPYQLVDVLPTLLEAVGATYPSTREGVPVTPLAGESMLGTLRGSVAMEKTLWWEHVGNAAIQRGRWKLVREYDWPWELYDITTDRSELNDLASSHPDVVSELAAEWDDLAERHGVIPFRKTLDIFRQRGLGWIHAIG